MTDGVETKPAENHFTFFITEVTASVFATDRLIGGHLPLTSPISALIPSPAKP